MDDRDLDRDARLFRPPSWRPWVAGGVLVGLAALPVGFVGLMTRAIGRALCVRRPGVHQPGRELGVHQPGRELGVL